MVTNVYCSIISLYWYLIDYVLSFVLCGIFSIIINLLGGISFWTHHVQCIKLAKNIWEICHYPWRGIYESNDYCKIWLRIDVK